MATARPKGRGYEIRVAEIPTAVYIEAAADADQDGSVTIIDATAIQRWLVQLPSNENIGKVMV